jgi:hypothetical protein
MDGSKRWRLNCFVHCHGNKKASKIFTIAHTLNGKIHSTVHISSNQRYCTTAFQTKRPNLDLAEIWIVKFQAENRHRHDCDSVDENCRNYQNSVVYTLTHTQGSIDRQ